MQNDEAVRPKIRNINKIIWIMWNMVDDNMDVQKIDTDARLIVITGY